MLTKNSDSIGLEQAKEKERASEVGRKASAETNLPQNAAQETGTGKGRETSGSHDSRLQHEVSSTPPIVNDLTL